MERMYKEACGAIKTDVKQILGFFGVRIDTPWSRSVFDSAFDRVIGDPQIRSFIESAISRPPASLDAAKEVLNEAVQGYTSALADKIKAKLAAQQQDEE